MFPSCAWTLSPQLVALFWDYLVASSHLCLPLSTWCCPVREGAHQALICSNSTASRVEPCACWAGTRCFAFSLPYVSDEDVSWGHHIF